MKKRLPVSSSTPLLTFMGSHETHHHSGLDSEIMQVTRTESSGLTILSPLSLGHSLILCILRQVLQKHLSQSAQFFLKGNASAFKACMFSLEQERGLCQPKDCIVNLYFSFSYRKEFRCIHSLNLDGKMGEEKGNQRNQIIRLYIISLPNNLI